ncbi:Epi6-like protease inhibitor [Phytophthora megakarya]|uniref:Epi6-like protease inhibitor n=1 Tax=Phytophthora megakarya TaxID=4795 RepID=A0A225WXI8_9STRA|nr:Epi6-like protease inhibitor [Phytophthora megakarya]
MCKEKLKSGSKEEDDASDKSCNYICPKSMLQVIRPPVIDDDGNAYESECEMKRAHCKQKAAKGKKKERQSDESDSADGDSTDQNDTFCPQLCLDNYDPVTDETGKTYSNACYMKRAKCKGKKKDVDVLAEYERIYGKPFGASRKTNVDNDTDK